MLLCVFWHGLRGNRYGGLGQEAQALLQVTEQVANDLLNTVLDLLFRKTSYCRSAEVPRAGNYEFHTN